MADSSPPSRVLVIRRRYLGDLVLLGSVFHNLRLHDPRARIVLLSEQAYASVGALHPDINAILVFPKRLTQWPAFIRKLRRYRFTHVLDFDNTDKTAFVTRLTGATVRVTYDRETNPFRHRWVYTGHAKVSNAFYTSEHITETYLRLLEPAGIPIVSREIKLVPHEDDLIAIGKYTAHPSSTRPRILLHPGSRSRFRIWPAERFAEVCDQAQDELDAQVFIIAGPGERALAREIRDLARSHVVLIDEVFATGQFAALLSQFNLFLCHDSGPMHIAAGIGVPVVALFGSQNAAIWKPVGEGHTVLQTELPCTCLPITPTPCVPQDSYRSYCVRKLTVEEVFAALRKKLAARN